MRLIVLQAPLLLRNLQSMPQQAIVLVPSDRSFLITHERCVCRTTTAVGRMGAPRAGHPPFALLWSHPFGIVILSNVKSEIESFSGWPTVASYLHQ